MGVSTAYAAITITLAADVKITGDTELDGKLIDTNNEAGTSGQVLSSTETGIDWIEVPKELIKINHCDVSPPPCLTLTPVPLDPTYSLYLAFDETGAGPSCPPGTMLVGGTWKIVDDIGGIFTCTGFSIEDFIYNDGSFDLWAAAISDPTEVCLGAIETIPEFTLWPVAYCMPNDPNQLICQCGDGAIITSCVDIDCSSVSEQFAFCEPICAAHGGVADVLCLANDLVCTG